jgi:hypothetical protein
MWSAHKRQVMNTAHSAGENLSKFLGIEPRSSVAYSVFVMSILVHVRYVAIYFFGLRANYMLTPLYVQYLIDFFMCTGTSLRIFLTCSVSDWVSFLHGSVECTRSKQILCGLFTTVMGPQIIQITCEWYSNWSVVLRAGHCASYKFCALTGDINDLWTGGSKTAWRAGCKAEVTCSWWRKANDRALILKRSAI